MLVTFEASKEGFKFLLSKGGISEGERHSLRTHVVRFVIVSFQATIKYWHCFTFSFPDFACSFMLYDTADKCTSHGVNEIPRFLATRSAFHYTTFLLPVLDGISREFADLGLFPCWFSLLPALTYIQNHAAEPAAPAWRCGLFLGTRLKLTITDLHRQRGAIPSFYIRCYFLSPAEPISHTNRAHTHAKRKAKSQASPRGFVLTCSSTPHWPPIPWIYSSLQKYTLKHKSSSFITSKPSKYDALIKSSQQKQQNYRVIVTLNCKMWTLPLIFKCNSVYLQIKAKGTNMVLKFCPGNLSWKNIFLVISLHKSSNPARSNYIIHRHTVAVLYAVAYAR